MSERLSERDVAQVVLLPGDGIGPEVVGATERLIDAVGGIETTELPIGVPSMEEYGVRLADETIVAAESAQAVLFGAVSIDAFEEKYPDKKPDNCLLRLREELELYANIRPAKEFSALTGRQSSKPIDLIVVRELSGGMYYGAKSRRANYAFDTNLYNRDQVERIAHRAFQIAEQRGIRDKKEPHVTSIDKANVLDSSKFWREIVEGVAEEYPGVPFDENDHLLVDNAAAQLVLHPEKFDVIVTENMFGDILSDEAAAVAHGTLGLAPSASLGERRPGLFEPIHGSAPDITGEGTANPLATFLSLAMLLREGLDRPEDATAIESAVNEALKQRYRTPDLLNSNDPSEKHLYHMVGTEDMTDIVTDAFRDELEKISDRPASSKDVD